MGVYCYSASCCSLCEYLLWCMCRDITDLDNSWTQSFTVFAKSINSCTCESVQYLKLYFTFLVVTAVCNSSSKIVQWDIRANCDLFTCIVSSSALILPCSPLSRIIWEDKRSPVKREHWVCSLISDWLTTDFWVLLKYPSALLPYPVLKEIVAVKDTYSSCKYMFNRIVLLSSLKLLCQQY